MKAHELRDIAAKLLRLADEMDGIKTANGTVSVTIPQLDLFSAIDEREDKPIEPQEKTCHEPPQEPVRRHYQRNGKRMTEASVVDTEKKIGKAEGFCNRNDIERSIRRVTGRSPEDIREAVNRVAARMQLVCVKSRSYRYYQRSKRDDIINAAFVELDGI